MPDARSTVRLAPSYVKHLLLFLLLLLLPLPWLASLTSRKTYQPVLDTVARALGYGKGTKKGGMPAKDSSSFFFLCVGVSLYQQSSSSR